MRSSMPTLHCDYEQGCDEMVTDLYEQCADSVNGVRVTANARCPGWVSSEFEDFCPEHAPTTTKENEL